MDKLSKIEQIRAIALMQAIAAAIVNERGVPSEEILSTANQFEDYIFLGRSTTRRSDG